MNHSDHEIGTMAWLKFQASEISRLYKEEPNEAAARLYMVISCWNRTPGMKPMEQGKHTNEHDDCGSYCGWCGTTKELFATTQCIW